MQSERTHDVFSYRNEWQRASLNIIVTNSLLINSYEDFFRKYDITAQQYNLLRILRNHFPKPISTSVLRSQMLDKMSDTSRLVSRLKAKGLVEVDRNVSDKRLVNIVISAKGRDMLQMIDFDLFKLDNLLQALTEKEATTLAHLLEKVRTSILTAEERLAVLEEANQTV